MGKYAIVTVLDNLSETSMPWNEFVLYRHKNSNIKQYVLVCDSDGHGNFIPQDLDITFTGFDIKAIRTAMKRIVSECNAHRCDFVVHLHQSKSAVFFQMATFFDGYAKKTLFTIHSQFPAYNFQNKTASLFNVLRARRVNAVSETSYQAYPGFVKKIKGNRMSYIANGVDLERIDDIVQNISKQPGNKKRFVYVARMVPIKRHMFLIDVFHKVDADFELILIGAEDANGCIRAKINEYGMADKIVMTGMIARDEVFARLVNSDVYVSSSSIEGLPVSVLEAMTVGLLPIVSDIGPHREISCVCDEMEILPFDENVWVKKIKEIIDTPNEILTECGKKCREAVVSEFSLQAMHQKYYKEYEELLK